MPKVLVQPVSSQEWEEFLAAPRITARWPSSTGYRAARFTIARFPTHTSAVTALPPEERAKIRKIARVILESRQRWAQPVSTIELVGHADRDSPRRPEFEQRISMERARAVEAALLNEVEQLTGGFGPTPPRPLYSRRLEWKRSGAGATRLAFAAARTEAERSVNRRVVVTLAAGAAPKAPQRRALVSQQSAPQSPITPKLEEAMKLFRSCVVRDKCCGLDKQLKVDLNSIRNGAIPPATIGGQNCFAAVNEAACRLSKGDNPAKKPPPAVFGDFAAGKDTRAPYSKTMTCCPWRPDFPTRCKNKDYAARCTHCFTDPAAHLVVTYRSQELDRAVSTLKIAIDAGFVVRAGVLSGICDDKPQVACAQRTAAGEIWKRCPEHYVLIIARDDNAFLFYDSSAASVAKRGEFKFGLFFYDSAAARLSTARTAANLNVNEDGFHTALGFSDNSRQKRFQVLDLALLGQWKCTGKETVPVRTQCRTF